MDLGAGPGYEIRRMAAMARRAINAQYNVAKPDSLAMRVVAAARRRMFDRFLAQTGLAPGDAVLDVGVTSDTSYESSNYLEAWYPHRDRITAVGLDDASFLETLYPGVKFQRADGRALPFADKSFDVVHSSAVLEHVGSRAEQARFLSELARVARKAVFVTTPDRAFPMEMHSGLPLLHWLPPRVFRALLRLAGHHDLAEEANLNLLSAGELRRLCANLSLREARVSRLWTLGFPSNLLLLIRP